MLVKQLFDANSNVRALITELFSDYDAPLVTQQWNDFDAANNIVIDGGSLDPNSHTLTGGYRYGYADSNGTLIGYRTTQADGVTLTEFTYNQDGLLTDTHASNGQWSHRGYDGVGQQTQYQDNANNQTNERDQNYDPNGALAQESGFTHGELKTQSWFTPEPTGIPANQITNYYTKDNQGPVTITDNVNYAYEGFDAPMLVAVFGTRSDQWGSDFSLCFEDYDGNGMPHCITKGIPGIPNNNGVLVGPDPPLHAV